MPRRVLILFAVFALISAPWCLGRCWASIYYVTQTGGADSNSGAAESPFKTISAAIAKAKSGDTITIHAGVYRETVQLTQTAITVQGGAGEDVVVTGADNLTSAPWQRVGDRQVFQLKGWNYNPKPLFFPSSPGNELKGRTEQVIVDGKLLRQVLQQSELQPGTFCADPISTQSLYIWLTDSGVPSQHMVEVSVRPLLMRVSGTHCIVRHLHFRFGTNRAQSDAVDIGGSDNLIQDCMVEWTNGRGLRLAGTRNVASRISSIHNGHIGMASHGVGNRIEDSRLIGNNVKDFSKGWEAGGIKIAVSRNFVITRTVAVENDGPGIWFDIDNRDSVVEQCYTADNDGPGIEIEISEHITARNNLCIRNGLKDEPGKWQYAGILLGESMYCNVEHNVCVGNEIGIEVRQQKVRHLDPDQTQDRAGPKTYYSDGLVIRNNIAGNNLLWQFALFGDNEFFGGEPGPSAEDLALLNPDQRGWKMGYNDFYAAPGQGLALWGASWKPKHEQYTDLTAFEQKHHLGGNSIVADPEFVDPTSGDFHFRSNSPAKAIGAGFTAPPVTSGP